MRRLSVLFCAALMGLAVSPASAQQAMEDVVYLKDGSVLRGRRGRLGGAPAEREGQGGEGADDEGESQVPHDASPSCA